MRIATGREFAYWSRSDGWTQELVDGAVRAMRDAVEEQTKTEQAAYDEGFEEGKSAAGDEE